MKLTVAQAVVRFLAAQRSERDGVASWWDVPVAAVSRLDSTRQARKSYEAAKAAQRTYWNEPGADA